MSFVTHTCKRSQCCTILSFQRAPVEVRIVHCSMLDVQVPYVCMYSTYVRTSLSSPLSSSLLSAAFSWRYIAQFRFSVDRGDACLTSPRSFGFPSPLPPTPVSKRRIGGPGWGDHPPPPPQHQLIRNLLTLNLSHPSSTNKY